MDRFTTNVVDHVAPGTTLQQVFDDGQQISVDKLVIEANKMDTMLKELTNQHCEDCNCLIKKHDDPLWRFQIHEIRCSECISRLIDEGQSYFEAAYVV